MPTPMWHAKKRSSNAICSGDAASKKARSEPDVREQIQKQVDAFTDPKVTPSRVGKVTHLGNGACVALVYTPSPKLVLFEGGQLKDLNLQPEWIGSGSSFSEDLVVSDGERLQIIKVARRRAGGKPYARVVQRADFPEGFLGQEDEDNADNDLFDAVLAEDGTLHVVALVDELEDESAIEWSTDSTDSLPPVVYSEPKKPKHLWYSHGGHYVEVCQVPGNATMISLSRDGMWCAYSVLIGEVEEEANRGEWYICKLAKGARPQKLSQNSAGRVASVRARFSPSGGSVVYLANHSTDRPITKHMDLWLVSLREAFASPKKLTGGSMQIDAFDWVQDSEDELWLSTTAGCYLRSYVLTVATKGLAEVEPPCAHKCLPSWNPCTGQKVYAVESAEEFEGLYDEKLKKVVRLPQSKVFNDMNVEIIEWEGPGGAKVSGALYSCEACPDASTILVWIHGGPTVAWPVLRGSFSNDMRNQEPNFTALIKAGYLLFVPLYRGTLGFGDQWSMASIGCQGSLKGDLGDILAGVAHLQRTRGCGPKAGIFGESYGGYLTIKALADPEARKVFECGAACWGFINNRSMSLETGDFTWEEEFVGPSAQWPAPERREDTSQDLPNIQSPLLLLHGQDDEVCPISHSTIVYRVLKQRGVPTELVEYPGEGHGLSEDPAMHDCNRRFLSWFRRYLPLNESQ